MGILDSKSSKAGGQVGSSDTLANDNSYAQAPVLNLADERKGSGKYVTQAANQYNIAIQQSDYGAIGGALEFANNAFFTASDNLADMNAKYLDTVNQGTATMADVLKTLYDRATLTVSEALDQVAESNAQAQAASEKAMDITFQASQSEAERLTETSVKFLVGAAAVTAVATVGMPYLMKLVK